LEARLGDPRVFKTIGGRFGNSRGNLNFERDVVRAGAGEGGEDRVREDRVPSNVNESMVNVFKGGRGPQVRPSELTIQQRELNAAHIVDGVIEVFSLNSSEITVVLLSCIVDHVEIHTN
jgi:hypothetical protein